MRRKDFLKSIITFPIIVASGLSLLSNSYPSSAEIKVAGDESDFCKRLKPLNRILEMPGWFVWGCSPIVGDDGKIHVFFSRWKASAGWWSWLSKCEIGHAVAEKPEGPYEFVETAIEPSGPGKWDAYTCHNPTIHKVGDRYAIFYIGSSDGTVHTKSIGMALSDSLNGPWIKHPVPLISRSNSEAWDDYFVSNPAFLQHPNGQFWLYYKACDRKSWETIGGIRKYGLAIADNLTGPYVKYNQKPLIDLSRTGEKVQIEDAYVFIENGKFKMVARDVGYFDHFGGIYFESGNGVDWSKPQIAFHGADYYNVHDNKHEYLKRRNGLERPQLLIQNQKPTHLFTATQGGKYNLSSGFVFKID